MRLGPARFAVDVDVRGTPADIRLWTFESVTGGAGQPSDHGRFELLESGPDRCAGRYSFDRVAQLRVVEWSTATDALGTIERRRDDRTDLSARFTLRLTPGVGGTRIHLEYSVETPVWLLAIYLHLGGARRLGRRLAESWRRFDSGGPPPAASPA